MRTEKERSFLIHVLYISCILCFFYLFFRYFLYEIFPFFLGFLIAFSLRPFVRHTIRLFHLPQKFVSLLYLTLFYGTIGFVLSIACIQCFHILSSFIARLPFLYESQIAPMLDAFFTWLEHQVIHLSPYISYDMEQLFQNINEALESLALSGSGMLFDMVTRFASSLPSMLVSFFITILSSIFFALDFPRVSSFIMRQIPKERHASFYRIREIITDTILNYFISYGKLMIITFVELAIGLCYLGVEKAVPIAFMIACFDILPVLGTGTILFPWIFLNFFHHRVKLAVGLLILHLIINIIRQIIEPKIVGKQMGIHPLLMLGCMFFGVRLFGFLGFFIAPILVQIFCQLNAEGFLHVYK